MRENYQLTEEGFVFIDAKNDPYYCMLWENEPWIFYFHKNQQSWVSLRRISQQEINSFSLIKLNESDANIYHNLHKKFIGGK